MNIRYVHEEIPPPVREVAISLSANEAKKLAVLLGKLSILDVENLLEEDDRIMAGDVYDLTADIYFRLVDDNELGL